MTELAGQSVHRSTDAPAAVSWATIHTAQPDLHEAARFCLCHDDRADRAVALLRPLWVTVHSGAADPVAALGADVLARWPRPRTPRTAPPRRP